MNESYKMCSNCKYTEHDDWCDGEDGNLCQVCWEEYCDNKWWEAVIILDRIKKDV